MLARAKCYAALAGTRSEKREIFCDGMTLPKMATSIVAEAFRQLIRKVLHSPVKLGEDDLRALPILKSAGCVSRHAKTESA